MNGNFEGTKIVSLITTDHADNTNSTGIGVVMAPASGTGGGENETPAPMIIGVNLNDGSILSGETTIIATIEDGYGITDTSGNPLIIIDGNFSVDMHRTNGDSLNGKYTATINTTLLRDGKHMITLFVENSMKASSKMDLQVYFDNTPPDIEMALPIANSYVENLNVVAHAADSVGIGEVSAIIDGITYPLSKEGNSWKLTVPGTALGEGTHSLRVMGTDLAGFSAQTESVVFHIDFRAPDLSLISPDSEYLSGTVDIVSSATDSSPLSVEFRVDSGQWIKMKDYGNWKGSLNTENYKDGRHVLELRAVDITGKAASLKKDVIFDNHAPVLSIIQAPSSRVRGIVRFSVSATDAAGIASVTLQIENSKYNMVNDGSVYRADVNTTGLPDGNVIYKITATDLSGKSSELSGNFTVDNTAPKVVYDGNDHIDENESVRFSVGDAVQVWARVDGGSWIKVNITNGTVSIVPGTFVSGGTHYVEIKAMDSTGNIAYYGTSIVINVQNEEENMYEAAPESIDVASLFLGIVAVLLAAILILVLLQKKQR